MAERAQVDVVAKYLAARDASEKWAKVAKDAKETLEQCEGEVLKLYEAEGISGVKVNGRLVSLTRTIRASARAGQEDALIAAMHAHGLDDIVRERIMPSTLAAWVRERDRDDEPLPEDIAELLNVAEMFGLSVRKS
jgi:hypothetical protein